jgi:protein-tyrosine phosphatase
MMKKAALAGLAVLLAGAIPAVAGVTDLACTQTAPNEYRLTFSFTEGAHEVQILASADPDGAKDLQPVVKTAENDVTVHAGQPGQRMYFFLKPDKGEQREVSIRHIELEGTPNFRDLGGYETTDGHFVRWGILYRSGVLSNLTTHDFVYLNQLGIHVVCDFRTAQENANNPEIWLADPKVEHISLPIGGTPPPATPPAKDTTPTMQEFLAAHPNATTAELKAWMAKIYGGFAFSAASQYSKVFDEIKNEHLPLLYHCAAGKDRTGVFSAFLLLVLGVPENIVLADYQLTDQYLLDKMSSEEIQKTLAGNPLTAHLTLEQRRVMMSADPDFLRGTLRQIEQKYGSFDNYRRTALGVSDSDVEKLRARLLEE